MSLKARKNEGNTREVNNVENLKEILQKEGYNCPDELLRDWSLITGLSKIEQYKAECEFFKKKYGMNLEELETFLHKEKGKENFEKEEDIEDWEFSVNALRWWEKKVKELENVASAS